MVGFIFEQLSFFIIFFKKEKVLFYNINFSS